MKFITSIVFIITQSYLFAQESTIPFLESTEVNTRYSADVCAKYDIQFPIYRVYEYQDDLGTHELVLTENSISEKENDSIQAFCFLIDGNLKKLEWKLIDFILQNDDMSSENSMWFWTKYLRLEDLDNNGTIDPLIIYGSSGDNGTDDGRLKMLLYLNGNKLGIRHQNSSMDFGRNTRVDKQFYDLSTNAQGFIRGVMELIEEKGHSNFPAGWKEKMDEKQLVFDEN